MKLSTGLMYLMLAALQCLFIPVARSQQDTTIKTVFIPEKIDLASFLIVAVTDTAFKIEDMGRLMGKDYGELYKYCAQHNL